jgi:hypothetical protein
MPIYEMTSESLRKLSETSFETAGIRERNDLQRLLRNQIEIVSPDTLIIAEEFGDWEDSKRRIDLLGLDKDANLVVIELKRTEDGGHMELQAVRYAAMVSAMTFEQVVSVFDNHLRKIGQSADARAMLLDFLDWEEPDEDRFAQDVRIVLVSAEFSKELTTAVMWLNERDLDVRCARIKPYMDNDRVLIDVQQVIPLPEAAEYQVQIRAKEQRGRQDRAERYSLRHKFWEGLLDLARAKTSLHSSISPSESSWVATSTGIRGLNLVYSIRQHDGRVELYIDRGTGEKETNKRAFDTLLTEKSAIEELFGNPLLWERMNDNQGSRISHTIPMGGYRDDESKWPEIQDAMTDAMIRLEKCLRPHLARIKAEVESP